jgi:hypothetical protein
VSLPGESGVIPVTVANDLDRPARVGLRLTGTPRVRFEADDVEPVTIAPGQKQTFEVLATVLGTGPVSVEITLLTPEGETFGTPATTEVRSAAYARAAQGVVLGLFGILVLLLAANSYAACARPSRSKAADGRRRRCGERRDRTRPPTTPPTSRTTSGPTAAAEAAAADPDRAAGRYPGRGRRERDALEPAHGHRTAVPARRRVARIALAAPRRRRRGRVHPRQHAAERRPYPHHRRRPQRRPIPQLVRHMTTWTVQTPPTGPRSACARRLDVAVLIAPRLVGSMPLRVHQTS